MELSELLRMMENGGTITLNLVAFAAVIFVLVFAPLVWISVLKGDEYTNRLVKVIKACRRPPGAKKK